MLTRAKLKRLCAKYFSWNCHFNKPAKSKGQALVEFTLIFVLLLVVVWIPADVGLAFFTGQLAQSASREAARIAASERSLLSQLGSCTMPCASEPSDSVLGAAAARLSNALLPGATIEVAYPVPGGTVCNEHLRVTIQGTYNFFFYQLLNLLGVPVTPTLDISRETQMRWEHQIGCQS